MTDQTNTDPTNTICGVTATCEPGVDFTKASASALITGRLNNHDPRFNVASVHLQSADMFGPRVGFLKFEAALTDPSGRKLPGIVFARGGSVAVAAVLICEGKAYTVLTVQPRFATGVFEFKETCAGMLDGSGNFAGVAAKELKEELDIEVAADDLTDLSSLAGFPGGIYMSPGGCDETIRFFAFTRQVAREEMDAMNGRCTGALDENEQITLQIVPLEDLLTYPDAKTLLAYSLFQRFKDKVPGAEAIKS